VRGSDGFARVTFSICEVTDRTIISFDFQTAHRHSQNAEEEHECPLHISRAHKDFGLELKNIAISLTFTDIELVDAPLEFPGGVRDLQSGRTASRDRNDEFQTESISAVDHVLRGARSLRSLDSFALREIDISPNDALEALTTIGRSVEWAPLLCHCCIGHWTVRIMQKVNPQKSVEFIRTSNIRTIGIVGADMSGVSASSSGHEDREH
jgi:hypothetical protein